MPNAFPIVRSRPRRAAWLAVMALVAVRVGAGAGEDGVPPDELIGVVALAPAKTVMPAVESYMRAGARGTDFEPLFLPQKQPLLPDLFLPQPWPTVWGDGPLHLLVGDCAWPATPPVALLADFAGDEAARGRWTAAGIYFRDEQDGGFIPLRVRVSRQTGRDVEAALRDRAPALAPDVPDDDGGEANCVLLPTGDGRALIGADDPESRGFLTLAKAILADWTPPVPAGDDLLRVDLNLGVNFKTNDPLLQGARAMLPFHLGSVAQKLDKGIAQIEQAGGDDARTGQTLKFMRAQRRYLKDLGPFLTRHASAFFDLLPTLGRVRADIRVADEALWTETVWQPAPGSPLAASLNRAGRPVTDDARLLAGRMGPETIFYGQALALIEPSANPGNDYTTELLRDLGRLVDPQGDLGARSEALVRRSVELLGGAVVANGQRATPDAANADAQPFTNVYLAQSPRAAELAALFDDSTALAADFSAKALGEFGLPLRLARIVEDVPAGDDGVPAAHRYRWEAQVVDGIPLGIPLASVQTFLDVLDMTVGVADDVVIMADAEGYAPLAANVVHPDRPALDARPGFALELPGRGRGQSIIGYYLADLVVPIGAPLARIYNAGQVMDQYRAEMAPARNPLLADFTTTDGRVTAVTYASAALGGEIAVLSQRLSRLFREYAAKRAQPVPDAEGEPAEIF